MLTHFWDAEGQDLHIVSEETSGQITPGDVIHIGGDPYIVESLRRKSTAGNESLHVFVKAHRPSKSTPKLKPSPKNSQESQMIRRNSSYDPGNQPQARSGGSIDPDDAPTEGSAINKVTRLIEAMFSHRGAFWLGVAIALGAFVANTWFYYGVMTDTFGLMFFLAILGAIAVSFGTSLFQLLPKLQTATARMSLHQIFVAGTKPTAVPDIDPRVTADAPNLIADYRNAELNRREFFKTTRMLSFAFEAFMGVLFIGTIGAGGAALFKLVSFALSVLGMEWGVHLALKAAEDELPPHIQEQLNGLMDNEGRRLSLTRV